MNEKYKKIGDFYSDYLIANQGQVTATSLSNLLGSSYSHDSITRTLGQKENTSRDLWNKSKGLIRKIESEEGVIIVDDTVEEKAYMDENELICWHWDHTINRSIKGINQLTALYYSKGVSVPVCYNLIKKTQIVLDKKSGKEKRVSTKSKHEYFREMLLSCKQNNLKYKYILADSWFSSVDNMNFISRSLENLFVFPLKQNRKVALSVENKMAGQYQEVSEVKCGENETLTVYVEGVDFPLNFHRQVFQTEDGIQGVLYLVSNDMALDAVAIRAIYTKRWKVECFHKVIKSLLGYGNSPAHTAKTQSNHLYFCLIAFLKIEWVAYKTQKSHFALKAQANAVALNASWKIWQELKDKYVFSSFAA